MSRSYTPAQPQKIPFGLLLFLLLGTCIYIFSHQYLEQAQPYVYATATSANGIDFSYEVITNDVVVDWSGGGDFDPRGKCPDNFFKAGFVLVCKKLADGTTVKFLHHQAKRLLYRIDKDVIGEQVKIGLHWVTGTRYNAKYRTSYKGGKSVAVPNATGTTDMRRFEYGEAVSKKRVRPDRELFDETHIDPKQCQSWFDLFDFMV